MNNGTRYGLSLAIAGLVIASGCSTPVSQVITPTRVEAVTVLGTYAAGKKLIADGKRPELERALAGLRQLQASDSNAGLLTRVAEALTAAGLRELETTEGILAFGIISSFADLWTGNTAVLNNQYARAVLNGAVTGLGLAATATRNIGQEDNTLLLLQQAAADTRPSK